ncbi:two-partner secretion domain-containing protein [Basilea psittacipulmonis]|uniref:two-partner secretion domain-containing protein n=1 Tax=Basilea psittacipulmonis TaxID=1472345 RepID=UPI0013010834|nr:hemagglutinin repeat-containing protein [Basilea psittacipulmonis]
MNKKMNKGTGILFGKQKMKWLHRMRWAWLGLLGTVGAYASTIEVDRQAPASHQAVLLKSANETPLVQIQTPTAGGVSINQYRQFDVDQKGVILNNSHRQVQTQIGGWVQANPHLAGGEAKVIVNEVNSTKASSLKGTVEVGGKRADVVIANPSGIEVDGARFINASGVTLTTGKPQYQDDHLTGYQVRSGRIDIQSQGLDTADANYTQLLSEAAQISGAVWAKDLKVVAGKNDLDAQGQVRQTVSQAGEDGANTQKVAIDSTALGGMYADQITVVSTEKGAGVHHAGQMYASAGAVLIDVNGNLINEGKVIAADAKKRSTPTPIKVKAKQIKNVSHLASQGDMQLEAEKLDNQGTISSVGALTINQKQEVDNQGHIDAGGRLTIQGGSNLKVVNHSQGRIASDTDVQIQADSLIHQGQLVAGQDVSVVLKSDYRSQADIYAQRDLTLATEGQLDLGHHLAAGQDLWVMSRVLNHQASGVMESGQNTQILSLDVDQKGVINSQGLTYLKAIRQLNNTGRIYGDHVAIDAYSLTNKEQENTEQAGVVAARSRLDIGASHVVNQEHALLFSLGDLAIGGHLDSQKQATDHAQTLLNASAKIEAKGDAWIDVEQLNNENRHFATETYLAHQSERVEDYAVAGSPQYYQDGKDGYFDNSRGKKDQSIAGFHLKNGQTIQSKNWHVKNYYTQTYQEKVVQSDPAQILVGGYLHAQGQNWDNHDSEILVGDVLDSVVLSLNNQATLGQGHIDKIGRQWTSTSKRKWYKRKKRQRRVEINKAPLFETTLFTHEFETPISIVEQNYSWDASSQTSSAEPVDVAQIQGRVKTLVDDQARLPKNQLFHIVPERSAYLVEADPAFTQHRQWLGSDYMLQAWYQDPQHMHKRLGDGYYEQQLVNEQIGRLTGYRRLEGYQNDEQQFKALMDAGITVGQSMSLVPGVALSAEQVARLTSDMVWMVNQEVTLPDGQKQNVLVPKVYLKVRSGDVDEQGALISAQDVLGQAQTIENTGIIAGRKVVDLNAVTLDHEGRIQAQATQLKAETLNVTGGQIHAQDALLLQGDKINIRSTVSTSGDEQNGRTVIDRVAGLYVTGKEGVLSVVGQQDVAINAAQITNQGESGQTLIGSQQGKVTLGAVDVADHQSQGALSDRNHRQVHQHSQVGTTIHAQHDVTISAHDQVQVVQGDIRSQQGQVTIQAEKGVSIQEGRRTLDLDESISVSSSGLFSSSRQIDQYERHHDEAVASQVTGRSIVLRSGSDIKIQGSHVVSDEQTQLQALGNIDILNGIHRAKDREFHQFRKSGLMGTGGIGFSIGSKKDTNDVDRYSVAHLQSMVGSLKGNTQILAKGEYQQKASIVSAKEGDIQIVAKSASILADENLHQEDQSHIFEQKGLTVAVNVPALQMLQEAVESVKSWDKVGQSQHDRVNAMAAVNSGFQNYQSYQKFQSMIQSLSDSPTPAQDLSQVSVSITYGQQKNRDETHQKSRTAVNSGIYATDKVSIYATGEDDGDIRVVGSDVNGQLGTALSAAHQIELLAQEQSEWYRHKNQSMGFNAGLAISYSSQGGASIGVTAGGNFGRGHRNGDSTTYRNSYVGDRGSQTVLESGDITRIRGAQVIGQDVSLRAQSLALESLQDTFKYDSKQQNISAQVTVGYGFSGSGSYSQSKVKADYASVTEQSGIFAGDKGYQISVDDQTKLVGALITSSQTAEDQGLNVLRTGTLEAEDIANHEHYRASSFGIGGSFSKGGGQAPKELGGIPLSSYGTNQPSDDQGEKSNKVAGKFQASGSMGFGQEKGNQRSTTRSGVNTRHVEITHASEQQALTGKSVAQTIEELHTNKTTDNYAQQAGYLTKKFDAQSVEKEIQLQKEVVQEFGQNMPAMIADVSDRLGNTRDYEKHLLLKESIEARLNHLKDSDSKEELMEIYDGVQQYLSEHQTRYETWKEGGIGRALLQGGLGGLMSGQVSGAVAGTASSLAAPYLNKWQYQLGDVGGALINTVGGAAIGYATGGQASAAVIGANIDWHNRQLHPKETIYLQQLMEGKTDEEKDRLMAAACALVHCGSGVPEVDQFYPVLKALEKQGEQYKEEQKQLLASGEFDHGWRDKFSDYLDRNDEIVTRVKGAGNVVMGGVTAASSVSAAATACTGSAGMGCIPAAALGALGFQAGYEQSQEGVQQLFGEYQSTKGAYVIQSLYKPTEDNSTLTEWIRSGAFWVAQATVFRVAKFSYGKSLNSAVANSIKVSDDEIKLVQKATKKEETIVDNALNEASDSVNRVEKKALENVSNSKQARDTSKFNAYAEKEKSVVLRANREDTQIETLLNSKVVAQVTKNALQHKQRVNEVKELLRSRGWEVFDGELSFKDPITKGRTRPDIYAITPRGQKVFIEVKTGNATLSVRQQGIMPKIQSGEAIPVGKLADRIGFDVTKPLIEQGDLKGIPVKVLYINEYGWKLKSIK